MTDQNPLPRGDLREDVHDEDSSLGAVPLLGGTVEHDGPGPDRPEALDEARRASVSTPDELADDERRVVRGGTGSVARQAPNPLYLGPDTAPRQRKRGNGTTSLNDPGVIACGSSIFDWLDGVIVTMHCGCTYKARPEFTPAVGDGRLCDRRGHGFGPIKAVVTDG